MLARSLAQEFSEARQTILQLLELEPQNRQAAELLYVIEQHVKRGAFMTPIVGARVGVSDRAHA